jgi:alpha-L-arabinofuranosidase
VDGQEKSNRIVVNSDLGKENDYNDFGQPEKVNIKKFSSFSVKNNILKIDLPSKSVVTIELKK